MRSRLSALGDESHNSRKATRKNGRGAAHRTRGYSAYEGTSLYLFVVPRSRQGHRSYSESMQNMPKSEKQSTSIPTLPMEIPRKTVGQTAYWLHRL